MTYIDTHAHVFGEQFKDDLDDTIERSIEAGVNRIYLPNIDHSSIDAMLEVEEKYPENCFAMMGLHPCSVKKDFEKELYTVEEWLDKRPFKAVGEIGIDLYWDKTFQSQQEEALRIQIGFAKKHKLPIVLHCRDSFEEVIRIVEQEKDDHLKGVFHCFTGSVKDAQRVVALDFFLGLGGVVTFKNGGMDKVVPELDLDTIVLETDSPYLAPVPYRGKRNEPAYVSLIAERVAELGDWPLEEVANKTTANALTLFESTDKKP